jgi:hypothetical protein
MDQPNTKNMAEKTKQQYLIDLQNKQKELMKKLEVKRNEAKQVMEASITEANTAMANLPEGFDEYTRLDDHILNANTAVTLLHSAYQAISRLPVCCDRALLQKDMPTKIQVAGDVLENLKRNKDDITRARNAIQKMHKAVDDYNNSDRITAVTSNNYKRHFIVKAQPPPSSDNEDEEAEEAEEEAEEAEEEAEEAEEEAEEADEPKPKRRACGLQQGRACSLQHGSDCECDGDSD